METVYSSQVDQEVTSPPQETDLKRAAWASSCGSALEYYDFALYSMASALIFGPIFFAHSDRTVAMMESFGTYFLGFAVRPLGGIFFGILGDRIGRKPILISTILLMGLSSTLIGVLPTYAMVGAWAPALLILLRLLQGFGAGAEQAGAAVLMAEYAPVKRRGFLAALPFTGIMLGTILAAVIYFLVLSRIHNVSESWMWRIPFLVSILIVAVALWIRLRMKETPAFLRLEKKREVLKNPLGNLLQHSRKNVLIVIGLRFAENGGSSLYQALALSYIAHIIGLKGHIGALSLICAACCGFFTVPIAGRLTDKFGRRTIYRAAALFQLAIAFPVWWIFSTGAVIPTIVAFSIALSVGTWSMFGTQASLLPELFGAKHRYIGVCFARELSAVIAGGIAPFIGAVLIAWASHSFGSAREAWVLIASYLCVLTLLTVITTFLMPETRGRDLDDVRDAT